LRNHRNAVKDRDAVKDENKEENKEEHVRASPEEKDLELDQEGWRTELQQS
jgi:hypothetical protein